MIPMNQSVQRNVTRVLNVARLSFSGRFCIRLLIFLGFHVPWQVPRMPVFFPPARAGMTRIKTQASLGKGICPLKTLLNRNHIFRFLNWQWPM